MNIIPCSQINRRLRRGIVVLLALIMSVFAAIPCSAAENNGYDGREKRTVRVGCATTTGYHQILEDGTVSGYGYSYEQLLAQYAGWDIEYINGTWSELQQELADGEIDLLGFLVDTPEREQVYDFSSISTGKSMSCLVASAENETYSYQDYEAFDGMTVACIRSNANLDSFLAYVKENEFSIQIKLYDTYREIYEAIDSGKVDAGLMNNFQDLSSYRIIDQFLPVSFYYAVTKGNQELLRELEDALEDIETFYGDYREQLYTQYFDSKNGMNVAFTKEERDYLAGKPVVTVVPCGRNLPYEHKNETTGEYEGIVPDILEQMSDLTGITFQYYDTNDRWCFEKENLGKNVITCFTCDVDWAREKNIYITQPFLESSISIISRGLLTEDITVALVKDNYLDNHVSEKYLEWKTRYYDTTGECLDAVKNGACSCTVLNSYEADYYLAMGKYQALREENRSGMAQNLGFGVIQGSDEELVRVLSKTLLMISAEKYSEIISTNVNRSGQTTLVDFFYSNPVQASILIVCLVSLVILSLSLGMYVMSIRRKNIEILEANQAKSDFLSRVSHDLRTPMNAIINLTNIVEEEIDDRDAALEDLGKMKTSNQFLLSLINDVLDVTKIESKKITLNPERYSYQEFLNYMHSTFEPLCEEKNITLSIEKGEYDVDIIIDKVRFNQLCFNLMSNAVKYTKKGGHVIFRMRHGEIKNGILPCEIDVSDDGIGMSEEFQKKMFDPFSQEGRAYRTVEGTGLGLYIVKEIVELFDGIIEAESEPGKGTTFHISMNMKLADKEESHSGETEHLQTRKTKELLQGRHALVAEDNLLNQEIAKKLLENAGMTVEIAENGVEVVRLFEEKPTTFDVILMDIRMPVMNGYEAAMAIRSSDASTANEIPIIAMTANAYDEDVKKSFEAGMNAHLAKPVMPDKMYSLIAENLN